MTKPQMTGDLLLTKFNSNRNSITSESNNKDMHLFHFGIPLFGASENVSLFATSRIILITGIYTHQTEDGLKTFIDEIENNSAIGQTEKVYTTSLNRTHKVKINNFTYITSPNTNRVEYTMELFDETL